MNRSSIRVSERKTFLWFEQSEMGAIQVEINQLLVIGLHAGENSAREREKMNCAEIVSGRNRCVTCLGTCTVINCAFGRWEWLYIPIFKREMNESMRTECGECMQNRNQLKSFFILVFRFGLSKGNTEETVHELRCPNYRYYCSVSAQPLVNLE